MLITRKSPLTGITSSRDLDITQAQLDEMADPKHTRLVQQILHNLSAADREFYLTGYTEADWDTLFPPEEGES